MRKKIIASEYEDCVALAQWLDLKQLRFSHIPQETYSASWGPRMKNVRMGVRKGVPDYIIVLPNKKLLFIEMKREGSPPSSIKIEQREWIEALNKTPGVFAAVCRGFNEAKDLVESFLN